MEVRLKFKSAARPRNGEPTDSESPDSDYRTIRGSYDKVIGKRVAFLSLLLARARARATTTRQPTASLTRGELACFGEGTMARGCLLLRRVASMAETMMTAKQSSPNAQYYTVLLLPYGTVLYIQLTIKSRGSALGWTKSSHDRAWVKKEKGMNRIDNDELACRSGCLLLQLVRCLSRLVLQ